MSHRSELGAATLGAMRNRKIGNALQIPAGNGGPVRIVDVSGADDMPDTVTCSVSVSGSVVYPLTATIEWGVEGGSHEARVSVGRGFQMTVPATALRVSISRELTGDDPEITVSGSCTYGTRPTTAAPVLEVPVVVPLGGAAPNVPAPPFSSHVSLVAQDPAQFFGPTHVGFIEVLDRTGTRLAAFPTGPGPFLLPSLAAFVRLTNDTAATAQTIYLLFSIVI